MPGESKNLTQTGKGLRLAVLVLAAGQSSRMGRCNKLLLAIDGKPMLEHVISALNEAGLQDITVVTGHEADKVQAVLADHKLVFVHNPDYRKGISRSLRFGLDSLHEDVAAVLVCLGDMPLIKPGHIEDLIRTFNPLAGREVCVPTYTGRRGNPVLWSSRFFNEMKKGTGDSGAKRLLDKYEALVCEVPVSDSGVLHDFDTQQSLAKLEQQND